MTGREEDNSRGHQLPTDTETEEENPQKLSHAFSSCSTGTDKGWSPSKRAEFLLHNLIENEKKPDYVRASYYEKKLRGKHRKKNPDKIDIDFLALTDVMGFNNEEDFNTWLQAALESDDPYNQAFMTMPKRLHQYLAEDFDGISPHLLAPSAGTRALSSFNNPPEYNGTEGLLALVRDAEHSYEGDTVYNIAFGNRHVDFTSMSINQVREWQRLNNPPGPGTAAAGAYQIIGPTMDMLITRMGLTGDEAFDKNMQDRMAIELLKRRGLNSVLNGTMPHDTFATNLSKEWASLPKDHSGLCYYGNDGVNMTHAHFSYQTILDTVSTLNQENHTTPTPQVTTKPS